MKKAILPEKLNDIPMSDVDLLDPYEQNAFFLEANYLKFLDADRLLKGFCDIGGVENKAERYGGWETSAIQGHTLGHYLSAVSQGYAASGDRELKAIADRITAVLAECQNAETGYLAAIPESHYEKLEQGNTAGTWVPWYTMHKVLSGLIAAYELTNNGQALKIASKLGDWVYGRTSKWTEAVQLTVLNVEYGGMNDCLYELYKFTKSEKHLSAAHSFDERSLFDDLYNGEDVLNGKHANTTIPKIIGALNRYTVLGEEYYLQVAVNFWEIVINNHTYITGGNSEWEHFGEPKILDAERTDCNNETCNTYNMLKLSRELFKITGERKYADYYENTFINAILSSQNPKTGMTTYFQPMATGFFKVYSSPTEHFWCCTGSGMENFSKLSDSIYYSDSKGIYVIRYTSSKLKLADKGITITQNADLPNVTFTVSGSAETDIVLRIPDWCTDTPAVKINGVDFETETDKGFIRLSQSWNDGDIIELTLPMQVVAFSLPDNENAVAFKYGPWVLSADLGNKDMQTSTTGVNVTVPLLDTSISDTLIIKGGTIKDWLLNINENLVRQDDTLKFVLKGTDRELTFSPHYLQHQNRYGIYFRLADSQTAVQENEADKYIVIDSFPVANDQYEFSRNLKADKSSTGNFNGLMFRDAAICGFFSYDMTVDNTADNYLAVKYYSGDVGRTFRILIDGTVLAEVELKDGISGGFYDVYYKIPDKLTAGTDKITVTFEANSESYAGGIFDKLSIVKDK
ncbi:MAG: glycoside hydrolase family 127 protein [Oscillospiraceae bacterium]|nr:glycoside hydrolase family 127 protein [Oscillospiraceae bacterium]